MESRHARWGTWLAGLFLLLTATVIVSLSTGPVSIPLVRLFDVLAGKATGTSEHAILFAVRVPRVLLGIAVGGALAVSGVILQGMFRNPLVEPYTLGISGGAALGVALIIVGGGRAALGPLAMPVSGFLGALGIILVVYILATRAGGVRLSRLLLMGVMVSFITSSLILLIMAVSRAEDLRGIIFWIMGSLEEPHLALILLVSVCSVIGFLTALFLSVDLNALSLGEENAFHLGINVERMKKGFFLVASFLTGVCVSVTGIIGFVGLVVPHIMRSLVGADHRILLPASYLSGAVFLVICDTVARVVIPPLELPVGVITGIVGGGVFIYVLSSRGSWL
jgi:iron complex transport system permease protein